MNERDQVVLYLRTMAKMAMSSVDIPGGSGSIVAATLESAAVQIEKGSHILSPHERFGREMMPLLQRLLELNVPPTEQEKLRAPFMALLCEFDQDGADALLVEVRAMVARYEAV